MTGSVAIDVAIGLIFVYLLYSLFATILCEIVASNLGLRGRNLREAIIRLLEDDMQEPKIKVWSFFQNIWSSVKNLFTIRGGPLVKEFYNQATIKYLSRNNFFSSPSYISPADFSKALIEIFRAKGNNGVAGQSDLSKIKEVLYTQNLINPKTREHIQSLLTDANDDLMKFRILLERWYDNIMERAVGWYKQKIQILLMAIGLFLAWSFNVNTFRVVHILSKDDKSREQLVKMATAYIENHKMTPLQDSASGTEKESLSSDKKIK